MISPRFLPKWACCFLLIGFVLSLGAVQAAEEQAQPFPLNAQRILFLGDSITHAGQYIYEIETQLRLQGLDPLPEIINLGLSSETCSGLSEPDHPFPRPNVQDRIDRALELIQPDVVVACYGMNDGIYHPFSQARFEAYQQGIQQIIEKVHAKNAKIILLTPPPFDALIPREKGKLLPAGEEKYAYFAMYENYDEVLQRYGKWILQQKDKADLVIDVHGPVTERMAAERKTNPQFAFAPDGIHPQAAGHRMLAEIILKAWGVESFAAPDPAVLKLVSQRGTLLHDAWLSHVGHNRPGVKAGLPVEAAQKKAAELEQAIEKQVALARQPVSSQQDMTDGTLFQVHYPASLQPGELKLSVDYYLWLPNSAAPLRGIVVHQHGCGVGACTGGQTAAFDLHWQALARRWNCALMGSSYEPREGVNCRAWCDPRNGSAERFLQGLQHFSQLTSHPEVAEIPWCLWGHSGGGFWASLMQTMYPERIVAIWLQSGTAFGYWSKGDIPEPKIPAAAFGVPVMGNPGLKEKDHPRFQSAWNGTRAMQEHYRKQGAPFFEFAPDPLTGHETGDSRYLSIPFFDFWLQHRLPAEGSAEAKTFTLQAITPETLTAWQKQMQPKLEEFIQQGSVSDTTPPPAPLAVQATREADGTVLVKWEAQADFESGLRGFVIERDGKKLGTLPEKPVGRFGRPLFQTMSYHDTPEQPLPAMQYRDTTAPAGEVPVYSVRSINSVELVSEPVSSR